MDECVHHVRAMKMYILVRESLPLGRAIVAAAHPT
jgi:hypothetical protein